MKSDQKSDEVDYLNQISQKKHNDDFVHKSSKSVKFDPLDGAAERLKLLRSPYAKLVMKPHAHNIGSDGYGAIDKRGHFYSIMDQKFVMQDNYNNQRKSFKNRTTVQWNKYWDELQEGVFIFQNVYWFLTIRVLTSI